MTRRENYTIPDMEWIASDEEEVGGGLHREGWKDQQPLGYNRLTNERERYDLMGHAAAQRQAHSLSGRMGYDGLASGMATNDALYSRGEQARLLGLQSDAARGMAPSRAESMSSLAAGQSLESALAASSGARGMGAAAANMQAVSSMGGGQRRAAEQYAGMRAGELSTARTQYGQTATQMRGDDLGQMNLQQQRADAQARSEMAQRGLNQQAQMGYTQMGINHEQAQLDASLRRKQILMTENAHRQAAADAERDRTQGYGIAGMSAVASMIGGPAAGAAMGAGGSAMANAGNANADQRDDSASDANTKRDISPRGGIGGQLADGLAPYQYEYKPGFDAREGQRPGESNIGPMAQNMARNPVTATAVERGDDGLLYLNNKKATKLALGGIGELAAKQQQLEADMAAMKKRK